jgi:hypothetical protein
VIVKHFYFESIGRCVPTLLIGLLVTLICCSYVSAGQVSFKIADASGAELKGVLVIVQDLRVRDSDEVFRALTDASGRVPAQHLEPGLYRLIAMTPYGLWRSEIREFLVGTENSEIVANLELLGTHGYGDIVIVAKRTRIVVEVKQRDGTPASAVYIHVRDREATQYKLGWYKTDQMGRANVLDVGDGTVLVIVANGNLITKTIPPHTKQITIQLP